MTVASILELTAGLGSCHRRFQVNSIRHLYVRQAVLHLGMAERAVQETRELQRAQQAALEGLKSLSREVASPTSQLVEQAAQCGR